MTELLPCPFCGGVAELITLRDGLGQICECWVAHTCANGMSVETNSYDTEAEAIAAWNTRAERTCKMEYSGGGHEFLSLDTWTCSECGCEMYDAAEPNYCPNCGAKVVEE